MNKAKVHISVVSPVYGCSTSLIELYLRLVKTLEEITPDFEIILINDASPDNAWEVIKDICNKDSRVVGINLSRNFGQHYSITAGLDNVSGEWVVVMDCDLQDKPEEILNLYNKAKEGYDSVFAQRIDRKDNFFKKLFSKVFYKIFSYLTDTKQDATVGNFGIYKRIVIESILKMQDQIRFFPTMVQWVGFNKFYLPVEHCYRDSGKSNYNFRSLSRLAFNNIIAFSDKPLRLTTKAGFILSTISFFVALFYLILYSLGEIKVIGFTALILSVWFLAGLIMMLLGIIGIYIGKVFEKVKDRPHYLIQEKCNH